MRKKILYAGGVLNILLAILHMCFWKMLNWSDELPKLSRDNQAVLQVANIILIFIIIYFAVMSFILARSSMFDIYARSIVVCICGFYFIRLVTGYPFFGFNYVESGIWIFCITMIIGYLSVLFIKND